MSLNNHRDAFTSNCFSPDGIILAVGHMKGLVSIFANSGRLIAKYNIEKDWIKSVCFSPDGSILALSGSRTIYLWDVKTR